MALILQIETATACCSVALAADGAILAVKELNERNLHAAVINLFIEGLMNSTGMSYSDLDAIAISAGPGSYTGLRIGVSAAKGLCYALDKPLIAVDTLQSMAFGLIEGRQGGAYQNSLLCPMIDARRMEVFTAVFTAKGERVKPTFAEIIDADSFTDLLTDNKVIFFGDGSDKCRGVFANNANASFIGGFINSAAYLTKLAAQQFIANKFKDVAYFEPSYLKEFITTKK